MASNKTASAYIIAAKRTALGRVGGLHKSRRVEDLAAPVILAACDEAGTGPETVEEIIVGNATAGGNPARVIALASGLAETINATTIDQQDASGLVAIIQAARLVDQGEADVVVAGGVGKSFDCSLADRQAAQCPSNPAFHQPRTVFEQRNALSDTD